MRANECENKRDYFGQPSLATQLATGNFTSKRQCMSRFGGLPTATQFSDALSIIYRSLAENRKIDLANVMFISKVTSKSQQLYQKLTLAQEEERSSNVCTYILHLDYIHMKCFKNKSLYCTAMLSAELPMMYKEMMIGVAPATIQIKICF